MESFATNREGSRIQNLIGFSGFGTIRKPRTSKFSLSKKFQLMNASFVVFGVWDFGTCNGGISRIIREGLKQAVGIPLFVAEICSHGG